MNYQPDTDSKDNFPGNASQDFAKQRDMFYDLVKKWNEHERSGSHLMPDFYAPAVSRMLCLQTHPVNMLHFAELFQEQVCFISSVNELLHSTGQYFCEKKINERFSNVLLLWVLCFNAISICYLIIKKNSFVANLTNIQLS